MTKWFSFFATDERSLIDEMEEYFENNEEIFGSHLRFTFGLTCHTNGVSKIRAITHDGEADFRIEWEDGFDRSAGTESALCSTDLIRGFLDRIDNPESFKCNGLP